MDTNVIKVVKRTRAYWFVDGFTEMAIGGLFILLAAIMLLRGYAPQGSFPMWFLSTAGEIALAKLFGGVTAMFLLWWLKDHFTYPRTGYVRGNRMTAGQILIMIRNLFLLILLPLLGVLALSFLFISRNGVLSSTSAWLPVSVSLIWAIVSVIGGEWMGLARFRLLGISILFTGILVGVWQYNSGLPELPANMQIDISQPLVLEVVNRTLTSLDFLILICGMTILLSGFTAFLRYRKENPTPYMEEA